VWLQDAGEGGDGWSAGSLLLRRETARGLELKQGARERVDTEDLLLLIDDEEGPGTEIS